MKLDARIVLTFSLALIPFGTLHADEPALPVGNATSATSISIDGTRTPEPGLLTGGQPTPEQLREAARAGVRTIINLRGNDEPGYEWEANLAKELGLTYVHIPIGGADDLTRANVGRFDVALDAAREKGPVLVHCASGNRAGALLALQRGWIKGASPDAAIAFGIDAGLTRLEIPTRALLETPAPR